MTRSPTAIGVSPIIKELVQKKALATRLTLKEIIYVGMLAIEELDEKRLQQLADRVHQMQVNGDILGDKGDRAFGEVRCGASALLKTSRNGELSFLIACMLLANLSRA
ncbi:hypothetical protein QUA13_18745 [Microcoleus sp. S28C3]|uniref:hypothetical protein n=1 Tax=Microcoleus sp. S28C3 TaxID=3055414 RepID=UPI002FD705E8